MEFTEAKYRFNFENPPEPEVDEQINYPRLKLGEITAKIVEKAISASSMSVNKV